MGHELMESKISANILNPTKNPAFVPFIVSGYPSIDATKDLIMLLQSKGASCIELGLPFSDPLADGPVIQLAAVESLKNGTTPDKIFDMLEDIKPELTTPIVIFTYFNLILHYGLERFALKAKASGVSGFVIPDLPFEEVDEFKSICDRECLDLILLVAPTSGKERVGKIAKSSSGFVYLVSSTGVTGVREGFSDILGELVPEVKNATDIPVCVGFGVSKKEHIDDLKALNVDGVIIGSAIVKIIHEYKDDIGLLKSKISDFIDNLYGNNS